MRRLVGIVHRDSQLLLALLLHLGELESIRLRRCPLSLHVGGIDILHLLLRLQKPHINILLVCCSNLVLLLLEQIDLLL